MNFQTYSKSNKLKKRIKNKPENMRIFENTHEAIVSRKVFDLVQKHLQDESVRTYRAKQTNTQDISTAANAVPDCICTEEKP